MIAPVPLRDAAGCFESEKAFTMTQTNSNDPFSLMRLSNQLAWMSVEAGAVIWMRSLGMVGLWQVSETEPMRMVTEKHEAFSEAGRAAFSAAWHGQAPDVTMAAAVQPLRAATRSNSRRLSRRGSKT